MTDKERKMLREALGHCNREIENAMGMSSAKMIDLWATAISVGPDERKLNEYLAIAYGSNMDAYHSLISGDENNEKND